MFTAHSIVQDKKKRAPHSEKPYALRKSTYIILLDDCKQLKI